MWLYAWRAMGKTVGRTKATAAKSRKTSASNGKATKAKTQRGAGSSANGKGRPAPAAKAPPRAPAAKASAKAKPARAPAAKAAAKAKPARAPAAKASAKAKPARAPAAKAPAKASANPSPARPTAAGSKAAKGKPARSGANGAPRTPTTDPPKPLTTKKGANLGPVPMPTASGRGGLSLPGWLKPRVEGLAQKCQEIDWEEPGQLASTLLEGIKEIAVEELGEHAAVIGAVRLEPLRPMLAKALGREFDIREGLGGLGRGAQKGWLFKVLTRAIALRFEEPRTLLAPVLARPLFERAIAEVLERTRGTSSDPRTIVRGLIEALEAVATEVGLASLTDRIASLRAAPVPLEQAVRRVVTPFQVPGATSAGWAKLGFPDVAARGRSPNEWIAVPRAVWATKREDATQVLDRLGAVLGLGWDKNDTSGSSSWARRLGDAGVVRPYRPDQYFSRGDALAHPRFGIGVVTTVEQGRVEVTFSDAVRKLVHAG